MVDDKKATFPRVQQVVIAYVVAVLVTYVLASIFQSLSVLVAMNQAGAGFTAGVWLKTILHDLYGFTFLGYASYGLGVVIGFAIAMPTAALIHRLSGLPRWFLYPLAGATSMATEMYIIKGNFYDTTIFPGTRGLTGFTLQLLAGALGGLIFAKLSKQQE
jgi:hypothetical protein